MKRIAVAIMAAGLLASAQETKIQERKENQQQRIGEGVASGSLTAKETRNLENKQTRLNKEIRHDRKVNGGNLTDKEKKQINRQQNRLSEDIYDKKHNSRTQK